MAKNLLSYNRLIDRFHKTKILVIGDMMIDRFVRGKVSRISPEAPVPVVFVKSESDLPGGAGNVAMNLASLGAEVTCCGVIGEDWVGDNLLDKFHRSGIITDGIQRDSTLTSILKTRVIADHQQVVRFDRENEEGIPYPTRSEIEKKIPEMIKKSDGIILSDYGKGLITRPLLKEVIRYSHKYKKPVCVDPKLEHFLYYKNVTCITPNLSEALGGMHRVKLDQNYGVHDLGKDILKRLKCTSVLITQGEDGLTLFEKNKSTHISANAHEVFDVTGAGDTVIGVLTLSLACGANLVDSSTLANLAAGIVIGKVGTATVTPGELKASLSSL